MAARLNLRPPPISQTNAARQTLADAIARREHLKRFAASLEAAAESAMQETWALSAELEKAQELIPLAEARVVDVHVAKATGRHVDAGQTVAEAREVVAGLEEQIETSRAARKLLNDKRATVENDLQYAVSAVQSARNEVIRTSDEVRVLVATFRDISIKHATLVQLFAGPVGVAAGEDARIGLRPADQAYVSQWEAAIRVLENDACASLPES